MTTGIPSFSDDKRGVRLLEVNNLERKLCRKTIIKMKKISLFSNIVVVNRLLRDVGTVNKMPTVTLSRRCTVSDVRDSGEGDPRPQKEGGSRSGNLGRSAHAQLTVFREKIRRPNSARQAVKPGSSWLVFTAISPLDRRRSGSRSRAVLRRTVIARRECARAGSIEGPIVFQRVSLHRFFSYPCPRLLFPPIRSLRLSISPAAFLSPSA